MTTVYVYALTDTAIPPGVVPGVALESIPVGDLFAAAERTREQPAVSEEALRRQHEIVRRIAAAAPAVLPARFGSLVDLDELRRIVERRGAAIADALELVRGREQMTVRVVSDAAAVEPPLHRKPASGTQYLRDRRASLVPALPPGVLEALRQSLDGLVAAERVERGRAGVLANVYHLIESGRSETYRQRAGLARMPASTSVRIAGPWPAFAFASELLV